MLLRTDAVKSADVDTIYYDASCGLCSTSMRGISGAVTRRGFDYRPLQEADAATKLHLGPGELPDEMMLRTSDGRVLSGLDAIFYISRRVWWALPFWALAQIPGATLI